MSAEKSERDYTSILKTIERKSAMVREKAQLLTERIKAFEAWLGEIPGRVETILWRLDPEEDNWEFGLRFHRVGKEWNLSYGDYHPQMEMMGESINWKPLKDAPLKTKIFAFSMFSDLLASIEKSQDELVAQMGETLREFDVFAERMGIKAVSMKSVAAHEDGARSNQKHATQGAALAAAAISKMGGK